MSLEPLDRLPAGELENLLAEEGAVWRKELDWDFTASAELVLRFASRGMLNGVAALSGGTALGYGYYVIDEHKGLLGDLFVRGAFAGQQVEAQLLESMVRGLMRTPGVSRIEGQLMLLENALSRSLPACQHSRVHERFFMMADLGILDLKPARLHSDIRIENWSEWRQLEAGTLIAAAYKDHIDSQINDQYRSASGARRFLMNIVQYPGCGTFSASASLLATHATTGQLCGAVLASLVAARTGHITQVCVEPDFQGTGLGYELIRNSLTALGALGCTKVSLTVTKANRSAVSLYERMGFYVRRRFAAYIWDGF